MNADDVKKIVASALELDPAVVNDDTSTETVEAWDSLGHVTILVELDTVLDGRVAGIEGIRKAYSIRALVALLREHRLLD